MPSEGWITVPGKGKRYRMADGSLRMMSPGGVTYDLGGTVQAGLQGAVDFLNKTGIGIPGRGLPGRAASAPVADTPYVSPFANKRQEALDKMNSKPWMLDPRDPRYHPEGGATLAAAPSAPFQQTSIGAPAAQVTPAARAQDAEKLRMMQQYASDDYWKGETGKAMLELAQNPSAPEKTKLADFYEAQRAVGIGAKDEIIQGLTMGMQGDEAKRISQWAEANPALALREYNKRFPKGQMTDGPDDAAIKSAMEKEQFFPSEGSPNPLGSGAQAAQPSAMAPTAAGMQAAYGAELEIAPKATAQNSNLNFNSPLPAANQVQAFGDNEKLKALMARYLPMARDMNISSFGN